MTAHTEAGSQQYPGPRQILRYLRIEHEVRDDGAVWGRMPVLQDLLDPGGALLLGAVAPMCDVLAGTLAAKEVSPDWVATLDFKLCLFDALGEGYVNGLCNPLRAGRNTVLSETRLTGEGGRPVGASWVTFTRLPRRPGNPPSPSEGPGRRRYRSDQEEPRIAFDEYLGLRFHEADLCFELDHHPRIHNSFGSIQGGAMGSLLARAGSLAGERHFGRPARTVDLHFSYTAQARVSPFRVNAEVLRAEPQSVLSRVELLDVGQNDRLAAVGTAWAVPIP